MQGAVGILMLATFGVDFGWQYAPDGKLEYIIQIPLNQFEKIRDNAEGVASDVPPEVLPHLRRVRIVVGNAALPRDQLPEAAVRDDFNAPRFNNDRENPAGTGFNGPLPGADGRGNEFTPLDNGGVPRSNVGPPLNSNLPPFNSGGGFNSRAVPGPSDDPDDPRANVEGFLAPPLQRSTYAATAEFGSTTGPMFQAEISRRGSRAPSWTNSSLPNPTRGFSNDFGDNRQASFGSPVGPLDYGNNGFTSTRSTYVDPLPSSDGRLFNNSTGRNAPPPWTGLIVLGLCLSFGANIYLGWLAWEYYLRYRESIESWRSPVRR